MLARWILASVLLLAGKADPTIVGSWGAGGGDALIVLNANGKGTMAGESFSWVAAGGLMTVTYKSGESEQVLYQVQGDQLALSMGGTPMVLGRIGKKSAAATTVAPKDDPPPAKASGGGGKKAGKDQLSQLLLSSPWCTSHYNTTTGSSSGERVIFAADGTWAKYRTYEGYSSGDAGTFASQHNSTDSGRWETRAAGQQLWMSSGETNGQLVQLPLTVTRNSSGYPILGGGGVEYNECN